MFISKVFCTNPLWRSLDNVLPVRNVSCPPYQNAACAFGTCPSLLAKKTIPFVYTREKKPQSIFASGDTKPLIPVDLSKPVLKYQNCRNVESAGEIVKKIISMKYAPHCEVLSYYRNEYMKMVRRHPLDTNSEECRIANFTVTIRYLQQHMLNHPQDMKNKVVLKESIDKRKKLLKEMRKADYKRFEWLLEILGITYNSPPLFYHWTTRKGTLRNLTREHCNKLRKQKIDTYRAELKSQQADFLDEKTKTLAFIEQETKEMQLTSEELLHIEHQQQPFKVPVFPKYLNYKKPLVSHLKISPE